MNDRPTKDCERCGRVITWRKKWERNWDAVRFCSDRCRRHRPGPADLQLEAAILGLLARRPRGGTICPSEAARAVGGVAWRDLMEPARSAARRLVAAGKAVITQQGRVVDPSAARGPIRVRSA
ncbi:MAG: DUF2256 and DUF3253 domain-containing protein [Phycisphaeraceae bacterium]|nr:MAG: DUF2256 and DUF3253 domain-containing protein [Phycisphaeraceae bacterium]